MRTRLTLSQRIFGDLRLPVPKFLERTAAGAEAGWCLRNGFSAALPPTKNVNTSRRWQAWKQAGAQGHAEANYRIGQLYARGEGVIRSIPDAVVWYKRAAEANHAEAQFQLGTIYVNGAESGARVGRQLVQVGFAA